MSNSNKTKKNIGSTFWARIRRYFIAGVLITAPISITLFLAWQIVEFIDYNVESFLPPAYNPVTYIPFPVPGIGLIIVFIGLTLIGALTAGFVGRLWLAISEKILSRMPVVRSLYTALKQIFETVFSDTDRSFKDAVLVQYPKKDMWVIGFLTGAAKGEVQRKIKEDVVNVFIPTTPNPTPGFLVFVPEGDVKPLDMSVEQALKLIISAGIVIPEDVVKTEDVVASKKKTPSKKKTAKKAPAKKKATAKKSSRT